MTQQYSWPELSQGQYDDLRNDIYPFTEGERVVTGGEKLPFRIAGLGDSYGAGEGNPSVDGRYAEPWLPSVGLFPGDGERRKAEWENEQCNRSMRSGFHYGVKELNDVHLFNGLILSDFVDFYLKNYACCGSTTENILDENRDGLGTTFHMISIGAPGIKPQVQSMREDVQREGVRYDAVLLSIGGNDVGFAPAIATCALGDCTYDAAEDPTHYYTNIADKANDLLNNVNVESAVKVGGALLPSVNMWAVGKCYDAFHVDGIRNLFANITDNEFVNEGVGLAYDLIVHEIEEGIDVSSNTQVVYDEIVFAACSIGVDLLWLVNGRELKDRLQNFGVLHRQYGLIDTTLNSLITQDAKVNIVEYPNLFLAHNRN